MKKYLIILICLPFFSTSQNMMAYLNTASFKTDNNNKYLETYLTFDASSIKLIQKKNKKFYGNIDVMIKIRKQDSISYTDHYTLESPAFEKEKDNQIFFIDQQRISLKNGEYTLSIKIKDNNTENNNLNFSKKIKIDYGENVIALSDIQLVEKYSSTSEKSILTKNGYTLEPYISNYYPNAVEKLTFYFEIYNSIYKFKDGKFLLNTYIETYDTKISLFNFNKVKRKTTAKNIANLLSFNISELPTGNYNLVCEIKDKQNNSVIKKKIFFQRSNNNATRNHKDIGSVDIHGKFSELITKKDTLLLYIDYLYPISTPSENTFSRNQRNYDNLELMQKFLYHFWETRDPINPELAWKRYYNEVRKVNKDFKNFRIPGYLTDRGRVYLQYGPPNSIHNVENATSTYPYQIWHYYKLGKFSNKKFVFVNGDVATNEYRLEYSNVDGEVSNAEWRDKLEQDVNPTFGDDFNNNYINPK